MLKEKKVMFSCTRTNRVKQKGIWTYSTCIQVFTVLCDRSFAVAGPRIWNSLPAGIRDPTLTPGTFATLLKTYLFD